MKPTVGRIVHYVSENANGETVHRAALITETDATAVEAVGLMVIEPQGFNFKSGVRPDEETKPVGTWHWPERE